MRRTESFPLTIEAVEEATLMVQQCLRESRFSSKESMKAALVTEEAISSLVSHGVGEGKLRLTVRVSLQMASEW